MKENWKPYKKCKRYTQNSPDKMKPAKLSIFQKEKPQVTKYDHGQKKKPCVPQERSKVQAKRTQPKMQQDKDKQQEIEH